MVGSRPNGLSGSPHSLVLLDKYPEQVVWADGDSFWNINQFRSGFIHIQRFDLVDGFPPNSVSLDITSIIDRLPNLTYFLQGRRVLRQVNISVDNMPEKDIRQLWEDPWPILLREYLLSL